MKISEIIEHFSEIQKRFGDLEVESSKLDVGAIDKAIKSNSPFPVKLNIKPTGAKRPDEL